MGIYGLTRYVHKNQECIEYINLIEVAREMGGLELLVDGLPLIYHFVEKMWETLVKSSNNVSIMYQNIEFEAISSALRKMILDLRSFGINLRWYFDGCKGCSKKEFENKLLRVTQRCEKNRRNRNELIAALRGRTYFSEVTKQGNITSLLLMELKETIESSGCEIVHCLGEADPIIARDLLERKSFAAITNDSDFFIFPNSTVILVQLFDENNALGLGTGALLPHDLANKDFIVGVITSERVAASLMLHGQEYLVEMAILQGNDYTGEHIRNLRGPGRLISSIEDAAELVRRYRRVENIPEIYDEMISNETFKDAVHHSRAMYNLDPPRDESREDKNENWIKSKIARGQYPTDIIAIFNGIYWQRDDVKGILQKIFRRVKDEPFLSGLRSHIYKIVFVHLGRPARVREYTAGPHDEGKLYQVGMSSMELPSIQEADTADKDSNLRTFVQIMTHYNQELGCRHLRMFNRKEALLWYTLRYFRHITSFLYDIRLQQEEFEAVIAMVYNYSVPFDKDRYRNLGFKPTERSYILAEIFQSLYYHVVYLLGSLLSLRNDFPLPREVFTGSVWTAFFMAKTDRDPRKRALYGWIRNDMEKIFNKHNQELQELLRT